MKQFGVYLNSHNLGVVIRDPKFSGWGVTKLIWNIHTMFYSYNSAPLDLLLHNVH